MADQDLILAYLSKNGPSLPAQVAKAISKPLLLTTAHLAELHSTHKVLISALKIGSSPVYYLSTQKEALQKFSTSLNEKEQRTYKLLQEKKLLRDSEVEPLVRVTLRQIKDFAIPLKVSRGDQQEIFWKWYLSTPEEIEQLVSAMINPPTQEKTSPPVEQPKSVEHSPPTNGQQSTLVLKQQPPVQEATQPATVPEPKPLAKEKTPAVAKPTTPSQTQTTFEKKIERFFARKDISLLSQNTIKKNKEIDYHISFSSPFGTLHYYCKAKDKKRVSDSDLTQLYVQTQLKKLPGIFLSSGELTKKAQELITTELQSITFHRI